MKNISVSKYYNNLSYSHRIGENKAQQFVKMVNVILRNGKTVEIAEKLLSNYIAKNKGNVFTYRYIN